MAVTFVAATAVTTNATTYATASFTPVAGDLLVFFAMVTGATGAAATVTDSLNLITFSLVGTALKAASADTLYMFVANQFATASARTLTFHTSGGTTASGGSLSTWRVSGQLGRCGPDAVRQFAVSSNGAASGTPAPTFGKAALTGNPIFGAVGNATSPATMTPPSSPTVFTEDNDLGYSTPTTGWEVVHVASGFTSTAVTWGSTSATAFGAMVLEIDTSARPIAPEEYTIVENEDPNFDITIKQGMGMVGPIAEYAIGDYAEGVLPGANVFTAPVYVCSNLINEVPGFNNLLTQGFLTLDVAEADIGDNVEAPPPTFTIGQTTLMGYRGYYVPQRILAQYEDMPVLAPLIRMGTDIILMGYRGYWTPKSVMIQADDSVEKITLNPTAVFNDWTTDGENQKLQLGYVFDGLSEPDYGDNIELPPTVSSASDIILMGYFGYRIDPSLMLQADDQVEKITLNPVTVFNDWTTDGENQKFQLGYVFDGLSEPDYGDNPELPPSESAWSDLILMGYRGYWVSKSLMIQADDNVEKITLNPSTVFNDWTNDSENQLDRSWRFNQDDIYDDGVTQLSITGPWDNDSENQLSQKLPFQMDDIYDDGVTQLSVTGPWDNDIDQQHDISWIFKTDTMLDEESELIILPPFIDEVDDLVDE